MPLTQIQPGSYEAASINTTDLGANVTATYATYAAVAANLTPRITTVNVANSSYTVLDDTAVNIGGGYIVITGSGFESGAQVIIDTTTATSVSYVNNTTLRAQVPSKSAATYNLYVVNPNGGTAIRVNGLTYSANPTWVTASPLDNWAVDVAANVAFNATGATSYSNTTSLPAGTQLLSNGYFYGTVTGISVETQYTFTVRATDAENQEADKSFSVTVTVGPAPSRLWLWGDNRYGRLTGTNDGNRSSPVQLGADTNWGLISGGRYCTAGIKTDGTLWVWGSNEIILERVNRSSPVQVGSSTNWSKVAAGDSSVYAIKTDGTLWSWGQNSYGNLGLNDRGNYARKSSPTQIGTDTNWSEISAGRFCVSAVKTNGTLWAWGINTFGQLGFNDITYRSSPVQVGSSTDWSKPVATGQCGFAIKTNGTLWSWGNNSSGQLGQGDVISRSSPTQVGASTNWSEMAATPHLTWTSPYSSVAAAIKTDGTLWTWAAPNGYGALGLNDNTPRSSPTQVGSNTNWYKIAVSRFNMVSIKTDNTLWVWGGNNNGQLGLNNRFDEKSSPTQIGSSTNWNLVSIGVGSDIIDQVFVLAKT